MIYRLKIWIPTPIKSASLLAIITFLHVGFSQNNHLPSDIPAREYAHIAKSKSFGLLFEELLLRPQTENVILLCNALLDDSKPIPALYIAETHLKRVTRTIDRKKTDSENRLVALIIRIKEHLGKLGKHYQELHKEAKDGNQKAIANMAALLYHAGFIRKSVELLDQSITHRNADMDLVHLKQSIYSENLSNSRAFLILNEEFNNAIKNRDFKSAVTICSQLCYLDIYGEQPTEALVKIKDLFPDKIDKNSYMLLLMLPDQFKETATFFTKRK